MSRYGDLFFPAPARPNPAAEALLADPFIRAHVVLAEAGVPRAQATAVVQAIRNSEPDAYEDALRRHGRGCSTLLHALTAAHHAARSRTL